MIAFLKKFVNSTIGTSGSKPLNEIITDYYNSIIAKITSFDNKLQIGRFNGSYSYIQTGTITSNITYLTRYDIPALTTIKDDSSWQYWVDYIDCTISSTLTNGEKVLLKPSVEVDKNNSKFVLRFSENTSNLPSSSGNSYFVLTYTSQRRKRA